MAGLRRDEPPGRAWAFSDGGLYCFALFLRPLLAKKESSTALWVSKPAGFFPRTASFLIELEPLLRQTAGQ